MLTTDPEHNKPTECICANCGKKFIRPAWSGVYSNPDNYPYKYNDENEPFLVVLCNSCAEEELKLGHVSLLMY